MTFAPDRLLPREGQRFPIREFMERALYDPNAGYYTCNIRAIGGDGADFATSASLDPGFAGAIAGWIEWEIEESGKSLRGSDDDWHLIELGGGSGHLATGVLRSLGWNRRRRTRYHIVETSPVLREEQRVNLGRRAGSVTWHDGIISALETAGGRALVFSNEFVDAFPATVVQWDVEERVWKQVWLECRGRNRYAEVLVPLEHSARDSVVFDSSRWHGMQLEEDQRCEVLFSWREWLDSWISNCDSVSMLTIDYGDTFPLLYRGRRDGTLRAYYKHTRFLGPEIYARAGHQDLTVDVNFTDLQHWGEQAGLETKWFDSQREFLARFGPGSADGEPSQIASFLRDPAGAGEAYRVLCQRK